VTDLTTLAIYQAWNGTVPAGDVAAVNGLITAVSGWIRSVTNRDFSLTSYTRRFDGQNSQRLVLPQYPIVSVESVAVGRQAITAQAAPEQPGYFFDEDSIILDSYRFDRGFGNVSIAWTAGYSQIPADLAQAANELVGLRMKQKENQGWTSKSLAGETVSLDVRDMPSSVRTTLKQYSRTI